MSLPVRSADSTSLAPFGHPAVVAYRFFSFFYPLLFALLCSLHRVNILHLCFAFFLLFLLPHFSAFLLSVFHV